ncbi:MAG: N-6 DNA methylase [Candidatus Cloacimonetes bacterium]|nr:N-6 DNA methylase [Candidatus Cloacimonadota bacterium]
MSFHDYLSNTTKAYNAGNATEHTHRPALKDLIESLATGIVATNEPRRVKCGAPDYIITKGHTPLGYIEAKDIGKPLTEVARGEQLKRYLESLGNLVLTDYLEFRWYVAGQHRLTARLASIVNGKIKLDPDGEQQVRELLQAFLTAKASTVNSPKELAVRMAALARLIRDTIQKAFNSEDLTDDEPDPLHDQLEGFRKVLLHDLTPEQFSDMYAQTICYGLFAARCNADPTEKFTRQSAGYALPKTNPFLRKMFNYIAGTDLDDRIVWAVDDLAELLNHTDIEAILKDFGKRTRQEDPVVHFYESFLAAYDQKMREARGVYYTPEPVVSYIVRSIDHILKTDFKLADGLADSSKIKATIPGTNKQTEVHKVQILDPATGTGTFLHGVVDHIQESFKDDKGLWSSYVSQHLLPRIYGFELLMAPYAVAHMKLGLQLKESGYDFQSSERIRIYLTNTLEEAHAMTGLPLFTQWIAEEANAASNVKKDSPVMVVLGNPPYSGHSANTGEWISGLLRGIDSSNNKKTGNYFEVDGLPLGERNPKWLNDDYVKFIRFAQWRIEQTGYGVLAFISNNGYLDNPTFRGMRQSLMQTFDDIYILDLHGNSKKKEKCPDGTEDKNVFDIMQGVAIGIFVKRTKSREGLATVHHTDLWGKREVYEKVGSESKLVGGKYQWLWENDLASTEWASLKPQVPFYLFVPQNTVLAAEYDAWHKVTDIMSVNVLGFQTHRDHFAVDLDRSAVLQRIRDMQDTYITDDALRDKYTLKDNRDWQVSSARKLLREDQAWETKLITCNYRPFDKRTCYFSQVTMDYPRRELLDHVAGKDNLCLNTVRQTKMQAWQHAVVSNAPAPAVFVEMKDGSNIFPLYLYPSETPKASLFDETPTDAPGGRKPNLSPKFIEDITAKISMQYIQDGKGDREQTFGPEDIFNYMYAVFHSPTYRSRYAEFLKIDFPRLPLTSKPQLFRELCTLGQQLVDLHLMESKAPKITGYPVAGDSNIEKVRYQEPLDDVKGRIWINSTQYFEGVPKEVWEFHIGGYQVCDKWLKDRKGRQLTYDDLTHYQQVVSALAATMKLMSDIDVVIDSRGGWPIG